VHSQAQRVVMALAGAGHAAAAAAGCDEQASQELEQERCTEGLVGGQQRAALQRKGVHEVA